MPADAQADAQARIAELLGVPVSAALARLLACPDCGELLWRSASYWSCPGGHGKLITPRLLARALRDVDRPRFTRHRGAERFLAGFQRAQVRRLNERPAADTRGLFDEPS